MPGHTNIARGKPTTQQSTGWGGHSNKAVDGNTNTRYGGAELYLVVNQ